MIKIHPLAVVETEKIGDGTSVWQFAIILKGATIGKNCNINCHTFIENDVIIGNNVTVKSGVYLWNGIRADDNVFIGPHATFVNDKFPRSKQYPSAFQKIFLQKGCSVGANATILGGVTIGKYSIVAAGSVVTKNVPPHAIVKGNPTKISGWVDEYGNKLNETSKGNFVDSSGRKYTVKDNNLIIA